MAAQFGVLEDRVNVHYISKSRSTASDPSSSSSSSSALSLGYSAVSKAVSGGGGGGRGCCRRSFQELRWGGYIVFSHFALIILMPALPLAIAL